MALRLSRPSRWLFMTWLHKVAHDSHILRSSQISPTVQRAHDPCPDTGVADDHQRRRVANTPLGLSYERTVAAESPPVSIGLLGFVSVWDSGLDPVDCFAHGGGEGWRIFRGIGTCARLRGSRLRRRGRGRACWCKAMSLVWGEGKVRFVVQKVEILVELLFKVCVVGGCLSCSHNNDPVRVFVSLAL